VRFGSKNLPQRCRENATHATLARFGTVFRLFWG
jgi:hypothetical protein